jgi:hypothetical protein
VTTPFFSIVLTLWGLMRCWALYVWSSTFLIG